MSTVPQEQDHSTGPGELATVFSAAPMFRRTVSGYDRFQVDTYVRWAEDELSTAEREREHLATRLLDTQAALDEARQLLSHSTGGAEALQLSRRLGTLLAEAADQADKLRAEAETDRAAAATQAERILAEAGCALADAQAEAERLVAAAGLEAEETRSAAGRLLDEAELQAEQTLEQARLEAAARLEQVSVREQLAAQHAAQVRQRALDDVSAGLVQARDEIARMLGTAREERRRADAEATATRERLDREAAARRAFLLAEIEHLEHRRALLAADLERSAARAAEPSTTVRLGLGAQLARTRDRLQLRLVPLRSATHPPVRVLARHRHHHDG